MQALANKLVAESAGIKAAYDKALHDATYEASTQQVRACMPQQLGDLHAAASTLPWSGSRSPNGLWDAMRGIGPATTCTASPTPLPILSQPPCTPCTHPHPTPAPPLPLAVPRRLQAKATQALAQANNLQAENARLLKAQEVLQAELQMALSTYSPKAIIDANTPADKILLVMTDLLDGTAPTIHVSGRALCARRLGAPLRRAPRCTCCTRPLGDTSHGAARCCHSIPDHRHHHHHHHPTRPPGAELPWQLGRHVNGSVLCCVWLYRRTSCTSRARSSRAMTSTSRSTWASSCCRAARWT